MFCVYLLLFNHEFKRKRRRTKAYDRERGEVITWPLAMEDPAMVESQQERERERERAAKRRKL